MAYKKPNEYDHLTTEQLKTKILLGRKWLKANKTHTMFFENLKKYHTMIATYKRKQLEQDLQLQRDVMEVFEIKEQK